LPRSQDVEDEAKRSTDPSKIDSTIHNYSRLESELAEYARSQMSMGVQPTDADLQRQARVIIYEFDDEWNQTAADNGAWLSAFKQRQLLPGPNNASELDSQEPLTLASVAPDWCSTRWTPKTFLAAQSPSFSQHAQSASGGSGSLLSHGSTGESSGAGASRAGGYIKVRSSFLTDANCYRRLARELRRFVASAMSPNNPNFRIPSDEELQHQARWILYEE